MQAFLQELRRGEEGAEHLLKCTRRVTKRECLTLEDVGLFLRNFDCVAFLGGGAFGAVFELRDGEAAKVVPQTVGTDAHREFEMQKKFAALGLAPVPSSFRSFSLCQPSLPRDAQPSEAQGLCLTVTTMPLVHATLQQRLARKRLAQEELASLGASLRRCILRARRHHLVHNDLKCNNVAVERSTGRVIFIDFGKSLDAARLKELQPRVEDAGRTLDLAAALDCWRLQASVRTCLRKHPDLDATPLLAPLRQLCLACLREQPEEAAWLSASENGCWSDSTIFERLKAAYRKSLTVPSSVQPSVEVGA